MELCCVQDEWESADRGLKRALVEARREEG